MRDKDAEFLMLNVIANKLHEEMDAGRTIAGYIAMHVEYPPCGSCALVIEKFQQSFRNVKLEVSWEKPLAITKFGRDKPPTCNRLAEKKCEHCFNHSVVGSSDFL